LRIEEAIPGSLIKEMFEFYKPSAEEKGLVIALGQQSADKILIDVGKF